MNSFFDFLNETISIWTSVQWPKDGAEVDLSNMLKSYVDSYEVNDLNAIF